MPVKWLLHILDMDIVVSSSGCYFLLTRNGICFWQGSQCVTSALPLLSSVQTSFVVFVNSSIFMNHFLRGVTYLRFGIYDYLRDCENESPLPLPRKWEFFLLVYDKLKYKFTPGCLFYSRIHLISLGNYILLPAFTNVS